MNSGRVYICDDVDMLLHNKRKNTWLYIRPTFGCKFEILNVVDNNLFFKHCESGPSLFEHKKFISGSCNENITKKLNLEDFRYKDVIYKDERNFLQSAILDLEEDQVVKIINQSKLKDINNKACKTEEY